MKVPDKYAGQRIKCPKCSKAVPVPNGEETSAEARPELPLIVSAYIRQYLMPGERLVGVTHIHPMVLVVPGIFVVAGLLLLLAGIIAGERGIAIALSGIALAILAGVIGLGLLVERLTTEFSCTDRRILIKSGLITTRLREMPLPKVEALLMEQGLFGKIFGYGSLVFKGSGGTRRTCKNIEAPFDFYRRVQEQVAIAQGQPGSPTRQ
jgi:uncharacterized membrane protein YdbT with pleckstrin-like domain